MDPSTQYSFGEDASGTRRTLADWEALSIKQRFIENHLLDDNTYKPKTAQGEDVSRLYFRSGKSFYGSE